MERVFRPQRKGAHLSRTLSFSSEMIKCRWDHRSVEGKCLKCLKETVGFPTTFTASHPSPGSCSALVMITAQGAQTKLGALSRVP